MAGYYIRVRRIVRFLSLLTKYCLDFEDTWPDQHPFYVRHYLWSAPDHWHILQPSHSLEESNTCLPGYLGIFVLNHLVNRRRRVTCYTKTEQGRTVQVFPHQKLA